MTVPQDFAGTLQSINQGGEIGRISIKIFVVATYQYFLRI
jgi:hypothetical protein